MRSGKNDRKKLNITLIAAALAIALLVTGAVSVAEFTKSSRAKRVVASDGEGGVLFSSNLLGQNADPENVVYKKNVYAPSETVTAAGEITVCNYPQGNPGRYFSKNIPYTLSFSFVKLSAGASGYAKSAASAADVGSRSAVITFKGDNTEKTLDSGHLSGTISGLVLSMGSADSDLFNIEFSAGFMTGAPDLGVYVSAVPSLPELTTLDAVIMPVVGGRMTRATWEGAFNDDESKPISGYDGFNYVVSGSGKGVFRLEWDTGKLGVTGILATKLGELLTANPSLTYSSGAGYYEFKVDSDIASRYEIQFYYADRSGEPIADWDELKGLVTYTYTEDTSGG